MENKTLRIAKYIPLDRYLDILFKNDLLLFFDVIFNNTYQTLSRAMVTDIVEKRYTVDRLYKEIFFKDYIPYIGENYLEEVYEFTRYDQHAYFTFFFFCHDYFTDKMYDEFILQVLSIKQYSQTFATIDYYLHTHDALPDKYLNKYLNLIKNMR